MTSEKTCANCTKEVIGFGFKSDSLVFCDTKCWGNWFDAKFNKKCKKCNKDFKAQYIMDEVCSIVCAIK